MHRRLSVELRTSWIDTAVALLALLRSSRDIRSRQAFEALPRQVRSPIRHK
jgi:hypothetical protein